ncbi:hypothetical protein SAMN05518854_11515 [Variovorax sp. YR266]|uniref:hypothetical protein n=1 Tax=Variovorax sp. YR266 TaxID=1884386 RepID=UPI00089504B9|nr:hypothetical protein [Variovorax sp. YR266]SDZ70664.1 hypothetical protein SAMN05518854_11515 [Variovorax sp. YR266]
MADNADTMVLRSFHLPQRMDDQLRGLAFSLRCAKADVLRFFIDQGLKNLADQHGSDWMSWDADVLRTVAKDIEAGGAAESVKEGIRRDIARMSDAPMFAETARRR